MNKIVSYNNQYNLVKIYNKFKPTRFNKNSHIKANYHYNNLTNLILQDINLIIYIITRNILIINKLFIFIVNKLIS